MNRTHDDIQLPDLDDERVDVIERRVFAQIADERTRARSRQRRRSRGWMIGGVAAAVIAVAALIAPSIGGLVGTTSSGDTAVMPAVDGGVDVGEIVIGGTSEGADAAEESAVAPEGEIAERDIIANASAHLVADDVIRATDAIADAARDRGGYVESLQVGTMYVTDIVDSTSGSAITSPTEPADTAWVSVRVPAADLEDMLRELPAIGEVTTSSIDRTDVTAQTVDLEARLAAARASVERLSELMGEAGDLSDLIAAEAALAERQAIVESYEREVEMLADQVAMSTLSVSITSPADTVEADPAGFVDGLAAGWNGLIATVNGLVIAFGFMIPWLGVLAVAGAAVWVILRLVRRRRASRT
ncbi:DUF4349 domain-containing protein [Microbacterium koreense]|uniref:DUF4349 domain-containing protein n=1 Tax=Microbacterium koreense TaxID=323761 RepID=A0ABW2ZS20_9MICO